MGKDLEVEYTCIPPNSIGKTLVLAQRAVDLKNHLLASLC